MAGNPSTAFAETELSPDPNYNFESSLPDWLLRRRKRQQKLAEALQWYNDLHWGWKLGIGIGLLLGAVILTAASGHGWIGVASVFTQVAIGVEVGVGMYLLGALFHFYDFSLEGLGNAALDSFLASSAIVFISSGVGFIKSLSRSQDVVLQSYELDPRSIAEAKQGNPSWETFRRRVWKAEAKYRPELYKGQIGRMTRGLAPKIGGKTMHLHHIVGKANDIYNVIKVTQAQHIAIHKAIGYHYNSMWTLENILPLL